MGARAWLMLAFIDALDRYEPVPFRPRGATPKMTLVSARDGFCKDETAARPERQPDDTKETAWLLENRTDLGANGRDQLLGGENMEIECVDGANHFSLVREPSAGDVVDIMVCAGPLVD